MPTPPNDAPWSVGKTRVGKFRSCRPATIRSPQGAGNPATSAETVGPPPFTRSTGPRPGRARRPGGGSRPRRGGAACAAARHQRAPASAQIVDTQTLRSRHATEATHSVVRPARRTPCRLSLRPRGLGSLKFVSTSWLSSLTPTPPFSLSRPKPPSHAPACSPGECPNGRLQGEVQSSIASWPNAFRRAMPSFIRWISSEECPCHSLTSPITRTGSFER